ncbi:MAG: hypothetical protein ACXITV_13070 [Luteibaculaceae bacterium]
MNQALALSILGLSTLPPDPDTFYDIIEEDLFDFKNKILQAGRLHPKILKSRADKAQKIWQAILFLYPEAEPEDMEFSSPVLFNPDSSTSLNEFFSLFEQNLTLLKLEIARCIEFNTLSFLLKEMQQLEEKYFAWLKTWLTAEPIKAYIAKYNLDALEVKSTQYLISGTLTNLWQAENTIIHNPLELIVWLSATNSKEKHDLERELIRVKLILA